MKNRNVLTMVILLITVTITAINSPSLAGEWRKGSVTMVTEESVRIDGRIYAINESVIIRDLDGEILPPETRYLRGVEEVLYRTDRGVLTEIRIFKRRH